jgi:hypothetical protein
MLEAALGGQGRQGGKDDGAILDEPAAATAFLLAYGQYSGSSPDGSSSSSKGPMDGSGFIKAFCSAEQQALEAQEAAVAAAAASAAAADGGGSAAVAAAAPAAAPAAAGSFATEWRWRRRSSPLAVVDRLRRMLLWRSAQAASRAGPAAAAVVTPAEAVSGSVTTPVGCVKLDQLPQSYVGLFVELLGLSMMPNAGVRGSALPSLQSCVKRFPCLVELLLPEVLAALAGVPGPLSSSSGGHPGVGPGQQQQQGGTEGDTAGMEVDGAPQQQQQQGVVRRPDAAAVEKFYQQALFDAMQSATPAAAAAGPGPGTGNAAAAAAAAVKQAMAAVAAAGSTGGSDKQQQAAAAAAAAAAVAAAKSAAADGSSGSTAGSVAKESENDGRVAGACAVLSSSLDATRVMFRDPVVFEGFVYALIASRCHSSNSCLKHLQMVIMQVGYHYVCCGVRCLTAAAAVALHSGH